MTHTQYVMLREELGGAPLFSVPLIASVHVGPPRPKEKAGLCLG